MMASEQKASLPHLFQDRSRPCLTSWPEVGRLGCGGRPGLGTVSGLWELGGAAEVSRSALQAAENLLNFHPARLSDSV